MIYLPEQTVIQRGTCRKCGCTDDHACEIFVLVQIGDGQDVDMVDTRNGGTCCWIDEEHTRCSACFVEQTEGERDFVEVDFEHRPIEMSVHHPGEP